MVNQKDTQSYAAFHGLLDTLREIADVHLGPERDIVLEERDVIEGLRNALHLLSAGIDFYLEGDPERPEFVKIVSPTRKFMGDNPDAIYHFARIRGDRAYRITGQKQGDECYISFTVHGRADDGRLGAAAEPVLADVNDRGLELAPDGSFEIILSADERPGNWLKLPPNAASVITRHYWERECYPGADHGKQVALQIEPVEDPGARPPLDDDGMALRLRDVNAFLRGGTLEGIDKSMPIPFVSRTPNELPQPMIFRMAGSDTWGAVDIAYAMAPFKLAEDEALLIEGRYPDCAYASLVLWNQHMQCFEYRDRRVSINRAQTACESDGSFRIVLAARDPGLPNWLDTEGHGEGTLFWRFLLPASQPDKPSCRVVPIAELR